jgi:hypothetical protein
MSEREDDIRAALCFAAHVAIGEGLPLEQLTRLLCEAYESARKIKQRKDNLK